MSIDKNKLLHVDSSSFTTKSIEEDGITSIEIEGFASTTKEDRIGDVIPSTAWRKGVKEYLKNPIILAFHNHSEPVGKMIDHTVTDEGLWIKARISSAAGKVFNLVKDSIISAFSVGFTIKNAEYDPDTDIFTINELELHEISVVSVGMNRDTLFDLSKSFTNDLEYTSFKQLFTSESESVKGLDTEDIDNTNNKELLEMDPKELEKLLEATLVKAMAANKEAEKEEKAKADAEAQKQADIDAKVAKAVAEATAKLTPAEEKSTPVVETVETGAEKLLAEFDKRMDAKTKDNQDAIESLKAELAERSEELKAMTASKMNFADRKGEEVSYGEKETAVMISAITGKSIEETKFGRQLVEKVGPHVASATWELEVSLNMEAEVRRRLVVAQNMREIAMQTNVMTIPINPEAGLATWITNAQFGTTASSGTAQTHQLGEITLNAYKLATLEYVNFEEEEDSLLALMPVIRDGMIRRVARAKDRAFLRGAGAGADPVAGLTTYDAVSAVTEAVGTIVTIDKLQDLRADLGAWGLEPSELIYLVSTEVYFDLLKDSNFQTVDKVGDKATLLTGQIGSIGNTPVLVSAEFDTRTATNVGAVCFAPGNFIVGNQRGLRMDTDDIVVEQRKAFVASIRTGMVQTTTNLGGGVSTLEWTA